MKVKNYYKNIKGGGGKEHYNKKNAPLDLKHPFRLCIIGSSGSGKTNILINLIEQLNCFEQFWFFVKLLDNDPLYSDFLIPKLEKTGTKLGFPIIAHAGDSLDELPEVNSGVINPDLQNLFIFDDMGEEGKKAQARIEAYYTKSRKMNVSCVYICQDFYTIPVKIRRNCTNFIFTRVVSDFDLRNIWQDLMRGDFEKFRDFKKWTEKGTFFLSTCKSLDHENRKMILNNH